MGKTYDREWDNEPLSSEIISHALRGRGLPELSLVFYDTVGSTNTEAKKLAVNGKPSLLVAEEQTGGRGRMGKSFTCPRGAGIYMSLLIYPRLRAEEAARLTAFAAVAVARVLRRLCKVSPWIKWVNDLYLGERKLAGILTEGSADTESGMLEYAVVGIGINVHHADLGLLSDVATDLEAAGARRVSRAELIAAITEELLSGLDTLASPRVSREYRELCRMESIAVRVTRGTESFTATALGVDEDLRLLVRHEDGSTEHLSSGDVSVHPQVYDN